MAAPDVGIADAVIEDAEDVPERRLSPAVLTLRRLLHHRLFMTGFVVFAIVLVIAVLAPWLTDADPDRLAMRYRFLSPSPEHLFGTDNFGRSLYSRVIWGARLSMIIGVSVVAINAVLGTAIGAAAGYFRRIDNVGDAHQRRADGVPGRAAGDRRDRGAGTFAERRDHRVGSSIRRAPRASCGRR